MDPLSGFYAGPCPVSLVLRVMVCLSERCLAITRLSPEGDSPHGPDGWFPEQRLTREEALKGK
jgi:hypothetical protein